MTRSTRITALSVAAAAGVACVILALSTNRGQTPAPAPVPDPTNAPPVSPGYTFPYKRGDLVIARVSWDEGRAVSLTLYDVKGFRCETFNPDGTPNLVLEAPTCLFNLSTTNASSSGPLTVTQAGDAFSLTGDGFNWNHSSQRLQISNNVHAVFRLKSPGALLPLSP